MKRSFRKRSVVSRQRASRRSIQNGARSSARKFSCSRTETRMRQSRNAVVAVEEEVKQPELVREFTIPLSARKSLPVFYPVRNVTLCFSHSTEVRFEFTDLTHA